MLGLPNPHQSGAGSVSHFPWRTLSQVVGADGCTLQSHLVPCWSGYDPALEDLGVAEVAQVRDTEVAQVRDAEVAQVRDAEVAQVQDLIVRPEEEPGLGH